MATSVRFKEQPNDLEPSGMLTAEHQREVQQVVEQVRRHIAVTFRETGAASEEQTKELEQAVEQFIQDPNSKKLSHWDGFVEWSKGAMESSRKLFKDLQDKLESAVKNEWISDESRKKWIGHFRDEKVTFKSKEYWMQYQFPYYLSAWEENAKERKDLLKDPGFSELATYEPVCGKIANTDKFLSLHYDQRKGLLAQARAALLAGRKLQLDLYAEAKQQLEAAEGKGFLGKGKTGIWLERTFKSKASWQKIAEFVRGNNESSLHRLTANWAAVKTRFDLVSQAFNKRGEENVPRGFILLDDRQFLSLHYTQRLRYVEEAESRLSTSGDIPSEEPIFLEIRHAMDIKDWEEAHDLIQMARTMPLSEKNSERLRSMEQYVNQFSIQKDPAALTREKLLDAKQQLDKLIKQVPSSLQPMILRLLSGPTANRSIHQLRWIIYNNKWCRTHGYLNDQIAMQGAGQDNRELTKYRAEHGQDTGKHDTLDWETSDRQYFRKKEFDNHKATYLHVNLSSGGVTHALEEWVGHEQPSSVLYWTTFCGHENGLPKSANWHNDLLMVLTQMRSLTRTMNGAGYMYRGPHESLTSKVDGSALALAA